MCKYPIYSYKLYNMSVRCHIYGTLYLICGCAYRVKENRIVINIIVIFALINDDNYMTWSGDTIILLWIKYYFAFKWILNVTTIWWIYVYIAVEWNVVHNIMFMVRSVKRDSILNNSTVYLYYMNWQTFDDRTRASCLWILIKHNIISAVAFNIILWFFVT